MFKNRGEGESQPQTPNKLTGPRRLIFIAAMAGAAVLGACGIGPSGEHSTSTTQNNKPAATASGNSSGDSQPAAPQFGDGNTENDYAAAAAVHVESSGNFDPRAARRQLQTIDDPTIRVGARGMLDASLAAQAVIAHKNDPARADSLRGQIRGDGALAFANHAIDAGEAADAVLFARSDIDHANALLEQVDDPDLHTQAAAGIESTVLADTALDNGAPYDRWNELQARSTDQWMDLSDQAVDEWTNLQDFALRQFGDFHEHTTTNEVVDQMMSVQPETPEEK